LFEINPVASGENSLIHLDPLDNVAIARVPLSPGRLVRVGNRDLTVRDHIPAGHKMALMTIEAGTFVLRYGQPLGRARRLIEAGEHVHRHNLGFDDPVKEYEWPAGEPSAPPPPDPRPVFEGYARPDGRVGTRNYIAVVAASNCAAHVVEQAARRFEGRTLPRWIDGVAAFPHEHGCAGVRGRDGELLRRTLAGVMDHPNVFASILIGVGCEVNQVAGYAELPARGCRMAALEIQTSGGTRGTVEEAVRLAEGFIEEAEGCRRTPAPASALVLGLNCGGSDSFSGITANPALGVASDLLVAAGGTSVLAETPEIYGAEHLLVKRAASRQVAERLIGFIEDYKAYVGLFGGTLDDNPSAGNEAGGLSNIVEKSLGAAAKGGRAALSDVVDYAERISSRGLVFMNTPGYDPVSLAGLAAGGVNLIAFTTGRGSAIGFPTIPVLKIATNSALFRAMRENMDINAGLIADGASTLEQVGREIYEALLRVASGERTAAERLGHREFVPWRAGPVL